MSRTIEVLGIQRTAECIGNGRQLVFADHINGTDYMEYDRLCDDAGCTCVFDDPGDLEYSDPDLYDEYVDDIP